MGNRQRVTTRDVAGLLLLLVAFIGLGACGGGGGGAPPPGGSGDQFALGALAGNAANFGALPSADPRLSGSSGAGSRLPSRVDLRNLLPEIRNQGGQGSCVGWCTAYYTKTAIERKEENWTVTGSFTHVFAPPYIYNQRSNRTHANPDFREGMYTQEGCERLVSQGCCQWPRMPYNQNDGSTQPSSQAHSEAGAFRASRVQRFGTYGSISLANLEEMKGWLADSGTPVVTGMDWTSELQFFRNRASDDDVVETASGGTVVGGHCIAVVGYDDNVSSGCFLLCNSHGTTWGNDGFAWIPYSEFRAIANEAYALVDLPNGAVPNPTPNTDNNNFLTGAGSIAYGQTASGSIGNHNNDPADWWKFVATAGDLVRITLTGLSSDVDLKVADGSDNRLAFSANLGSNSEEINFAVASTGTYYIKVYPYDDAQTSYSLSLSSTQPSQGNDNSSSPSSITNLNTNYNGSVGGSDPRDWWRVSVGASRQITVTLTGLSADIDLYVYRPSDLGGDYWLRSIVGGSSAESISFISSSSGGDYYILVAPFGSVSSSYVLRAEDDSSRPNLKAVSYSVTYTDYSDRTELTVNSLKVENKGAAASPEFSVWWGLSASNVRGSGYWPGAGTWGGGGSLPVNFVRTWSSGGSTRTKSALPAGSYYFVFEADGPRGISEPDELDNFMYSSSPLVSK